MEQNLTGETRWSNKRTWFGYRPVLQVAYTAMVCENNIDRIECETKTLWRDATAADYLNCPAIARKFNSEAA